MTITMGIISLFKRILQAWTTKANTKIIINPKVILYMKTPIKIKKCTTQAILKAIICIAINFNSKKLALLTAMIDQRPAP